MKLLCLTNTAPTSLLDVVKRLCGLECRKPHQVKQSGSSLNVRSLSGNRGLNFMFAKVELREGLMQC